MRTQYLVNLLLIVLLASYTAGCWAFVTMPSSARNMGIGGTGVALPGRAGEVLAFNPALLTTSNASISLFYNNKFAISNFEEQSISFSWEMGKLHCGSMLMQDSAVLAESKQGSINENNWNDLNLGLGFAIVLNKQTSFGLGVWSRKRTITVAEDHDGLFDNEQFLFCSAGLNYDRQRIGLSAVVEGFFSDDDMQAKFGLRLGEIGRLIAVGEIKYELSEQRMNYYGGAEAWVASNFAVRAGVDLAGMFTAGLSVGKGKWNFDYAYKIHPVGNAHYLSTSYGF